MLPLCVKHIDAGMHSISANMTKHKENNIYSDVIIQSFNQTLQSLTSNQSHPEVIRPRPSCAHRGIMAGELDKSLMTKIFGTSCANGRLESEE